MGRNLNGFVKIHRKLIEWGWYSDSVVKCVFLHLLMIAAWKPGEYLGHPIKPGQAIIGRKKMAVELGFSEQQIRTALKKLESTKEITLFSTNRFTIATVENWEFYQGDEDESNQQITNKQPTENADLSSFLPVSVNGSKKSTSKITSQNDWNNIDEGESTTNSSTFKQPTDNQQITNKQPHLKKVKNKRIKEIYMARGFSSERILSALSDFEDMRNTSGKPMTDRARDLMLKRLGDLSGTDEDKAVMILEQSIENCWAKVYPLPGEKEAEEAKERAERHAKAKEEQRRREEELERKWEEEHKEQLQYTHRNIEAIKAKYGIGVENE